MTEKLNGWNVKWLKYKKVDKTVEILNGWNEIYWK